MWVHSHSIAARAPAKAVWQQYAKGAWHHWDDGIEATRLDGPLVPGTVGFVKPRGGKEFRFRVTQAQPPTLFTSQTRMTGATYEVRHEIEDQGKSCKVTHTAILSGPLAHFYGATLGRRVRRDLPGAMRKLVALAEQEADWDAPAPTRRASGMPGAPGTPG